MTDAPRTRKRSSPAGRIRVGIGGWTYEPWRGTFYPADLTQKRELEYASRQLTSIEIRHAVEVRHESFRHPEFIALAREQGVAVVVAGDSHYPQPADVTAPFVYARIMGTVETEPLGYSDHALDAWAARAKRWAAGDAPDDLHIVAKPLASPGRADVYLYVISGHKVRNPAAAMALIERLGDSSPH